MIKFKKPIFKDNGTINSNILELKSKVDYIQSFVDKYNSLGFGNLTEKELIELFNNSKEFLSKKLIGKENFSIGKLSFKSEKILEILDKPIGFDDLLKLIEKHNSDRKLFTFYKIDNFSIKNKEVVISAKIMQQIEDENTVCIENEIQEQAYESVKLIVDNLNKLKDLFEGQLSMDIIDKELVKRGEQKIGQPTSNYADFIVNPNFIKRFK